MTDSNSGCWSLTVLGILAQVGGRAPAERNVSQTDQGCSGRLPEPPVDKEHSSTPAGGLKGSVVSFELACGALAVTWEVQLGCYHTRLRSDNPAGTHWGWTQSSTQRQSPVSAPETLRPLIGECEPI